MTVHLRIRDRLHRIFSIESRTGERLSNVLRAHGVPLNAVVTKVNGEIVTEDIVLDEKISVDIDMVRFYDLNKILSVKTMPQQGGKEPVYIKEHISFDSGNITRKRFPLDKKGVQETIERTFLEFVLENNLISEGETIAVAFSGGKDSLALLLLLERLKDKLPKHNLCAITVAGWEDTASFEYAQQVCSLLRIHQTIVKPSDIEKVFGLNCSLFETLSKIEASPDESIHTIYCLHQFMRRGVEECAKRLGSTTIALGLNLEDLFSSFLGAFTTGYDILDAPKRKIAGTTFIFPLFPLRKKEVSIYLKTTAEEFTNQGPTTAFDKGPASRGFYYYVSDMLQDIWPGIEQHVLEAFRRRSKENISFAVCKNCKTTHILQNKNDANEFCMVCRVLKRMNLLKDGN